jgi:hypothetical protein
MTSGDGISDFLYFIRWPERSGPLFDDPSLGNS